MKKISERGGAILAALAVISWSLIVAFSRSLAEQLGTYTAGGCIYIAGALVCFCIYPPKKRKFSWFYHGLGSLTAVIYWIAFSVSLGLAADRVQAVELGLINYLWPFMALFFAILFFRQKINPIVLLNGVLVTLAGLILSTSVLAHINLSPVEMWHHCCSNPIPYVLMLTAAVCWGLYSVIVTAASRKMPTDGLPYFMLLGGIILFLLRYPNHEISTWNWTALWQIALMALVPVGVGYVCWDKAMLAVNTAPAILISYLTPLTSAICSMIFLHVDLQWGFYAACLLVIDGALLCRYSIRQEKSSSEQRSNR